MEELNFRISSALKNLIGKELITDEFVAVFELVKNSFDANAKNVRIIFKNQYDGENAQIIIEDDGKGMSIDDLKNKWLFVGYSAKKDGTEDNDYRNKLKSKRIFAGAKGVGRFSCDRLGATLSLITKKDGFPYEKLEVDWTDFEEDSKEEFMNIHVKHETLSDSQMTFFKGGTYLVISQLRDVWDRQRILDLKTSLAKLINPNQENSQDEFQIKIIAEDELSKDELICNDTEKVNGLIKNFVFEKLGLKTTFICTEIDERGDFITTTLSDRGRDIYKIKERNTYKRLSNTKVVLFQLNRVAKYNFTKLMQIEPVKYGSVFMYKNGFRIYPFGEEGDDSLGIDRRKQQGYNRFLGTRDLIGRIEISGTKINLQETTSRDGGFIKNDTYKELLNFFYEKALRRLERYVVDVIKWGDDQENKETGEVTSALQPEDVKEQILTIITNLTRSYEIIDVSYDADFLELYNEAQKESVVKIAGNILKAAEKTNDPKIIESAKTHIAKVNQLVSAKREAEKETEQIKKEKEEVEEKLHQKTKQVLFLQSIGTLDKDQIIKYHHDIQIFAETIQNWVNNISKKLDKGEVKRNDLLDFIEAVSKADNKILALARYSTKANFNQTGETIYADIVDYISQYVTQILPDFYGDIKFSVSSDMLEYKMKFKPLEISVLIDNLISNSLKADAKHFNVSFNKREEKLQISFLDDGKGLSSNVSDVDSLFEKGITTTKGSGLGLFFVREQVEKEMGGIVQIEDRKQGFNLIITLSR